MGGQNIQKIGGKAGDGVYRAVHEGHLRRAVRKVPWHYLWTQYHQGPRVEPGRES